MINEEKAILKDVSDVLSEPAENTFHGLNSGKSGKLIDYIFFVPLKLISYRQLLTGTVDGAYLSDHYPVVSRL